jgi:hypothetical protein
VRGEIQDANPPDPIPLVRLGGERRGEEAEGDGANEGAAVHHSMT